MARGHRGLAIGHGALLCLSRLGTTHLQAPHSPSGGKGRDQLGGGGGRRVLIGRRAAMLGIGDGGSAPGVRANGGGGEVPGRPAQSEEDLPAVGVGETNLAECVRACVCEQLQNSGERGE